MPHVIAIVGAGASGTLTAIHLLRRARTPLEIVLVDRRSAAGLGIAYATPFETHLLNVRAGSMSALPDQPLHFVDWLHSAPVDEAWRSAAPTDFVPRMLYGRYLADTLRAAQADASPGVHLEVRADEALALDADSHTLELRKSGVIRVGHLVLALGNFPPQPLAARVRGAPQAQPNVRREPFDQPNAVGAPLAQPNVFDDPWSPAALEGLDLQAPVLLVGTGLTMVDALVALVLERHHQGPIQAVSRRGLLPQVHADPDGYAHAWTDADLPANMRAVLRQVRAEIRLAAGQGHEWRGVLDSLRPVTQTLWKRAPLGERERFLRHVQPFWDTHRHRIAPRIGRVVADAQASGQFSVRAGRLVGLDPTPDGVRVSFTGRRGAADWTLDVARVINCTGPAVDVQRLADPLLQQLLSSGLVRPDSLRLGLSTTDDGRLVDTRGGAAEHLFALGPMRRGELWETTAVPDIRVQAARLAEVLLAG